MSVPINDDWSRFFEKRQGRTRIFASPVIERSPQGFRVRNPRTNRVGGILFILFGSVFAGMGASVWLTGAWWGYLGGVLFDLFGAATLFAGLLALFYRQKMDLDTATGVLRIQYGFLFPYRRFNLDANHVAPVFDFTRLSGIPETAGYEHALISLRHRDREDEEVKLATAQYRHELVPLFEELSRFLKPAALDRTLVPVELPEGRQISVSWMPTGATQTARCDLDVRLKFPDAETARFSFASKETTLRKRVDHVEVRCEADSSALFAESWQQTVPLNDIEAVQICSQYVGRGVERQGHPDSMYELNLVVPSFEDCRLSLLQMWYYKYHLGLSSTPEARQLAESLGEFLDKPVVDHAGLGREG